MPKKVTTESYRERLASLGKVELLGEYISAKTRVLHRCLQHGEEHLAAPTNMLYGFGLRCCQEAGRAKQAENKKKAASQSYRSRLAVFGKVELIGVYIDAQTKVLHKCLVHGAEYLARPKHVLQGHGLHCCILGGDCKERFEADSDWANSSCRVYIASVNGKFLKPGIAKDVDIRAKNSKGFYGDFLFISPEMTREKAWAIEQQLLAESVFAKPENLPAEYDQWDGRTELRLKDQVSAEWFISRFNTLITEVQDNA